MVESKQQDGMAEVNKGVLSKLGRNVLLFQEAEHILKWMGVRQKISGGPQGLNESYDESVQMVGKETLGVAASRAITGPVPDSEAEIEKVVAEEGSYWSTMIEFGGSEESLAAREKLLRGLVEVRNDLIHNFYPRFNLQDEKSCREAERYLDQQYEREFPAVETLRVQQAAMRDSVEMMAQLMKNEGVKNEIVYGLLRKTLFVQMLCEIARRRTRPDGWTELGASVREVKATAPEAFEMFKKWRAKSVTDFVEKIGLFEVEEEAVEDGRSRMRYRLLPESTDTV